MSIATCLIKVDRQDFKTRADVFYGIPQSAFEVLADGKDNKVQFKTPKIVRQLPSPARNLKEKLQENFERIHLEAINLFDIRN